MDLEIYTFMTGFVDQSKVFDNVALSLALNPIFKSLPPALLFWFLWYFPCDEILAVRKKLIASLFVAIAAIIVGRVSSLIFPFKLRPMFDSAVSNVGLNSIEGGLSKWSAFPSDHATLYFSLAMCFFLINRRAGAIAFIHALFIVSIPRILIGLHWPFDILGGLIVGVVISLLLLGVVTRALDRSRLFSTAMRYEYILYPSMFFMTFQIATMFESARLLVAKLISVFAYLS